LRMRAYFLVPEETTPQRNMKIHGMAFANSFEIHRLSHTISIHVKKRMTFILVVPSSAFGFRIA
jgi:hypothetical protein